MRRLALILIVVAVAAGIYAIGRHRGRHGIMSVTITSRVSGAAFPTAPQLLLTDLKGQPLNTANFKGKVVVVNFWAAWCTPCAAEVPRLIALQQKYQDNGLQIIGISIDDSDKELRDFYQRYKMNYPVVAGDQKLAQAYGDILGLPTTLVINRDGLIEKKFIGAVDWAAMEREIIAELRK